MTSVINRVNWYLEDCAAREQSPATIETKRSTLALFARWTPTQAIRHIEEIDDRALEQFRQFLRHYIDPHTGRTLDVSTRRNKLNVIKTFFQRLFVLRYLPTNPAAFFELPRVPRKLPGGVLTEVELEAIYHQTSLHGPSGERDRAILETYFASGLRRSELAGIQLQELDMPNNLLRVNQGKGRKQRIVPIAPRACMWIQKYLAHYRLTQDRLWAKPWLFLNNQHQQYTGRQLSALVAKYKQRAGVDKPGACKLYRHTAATRMLDNGADIRIIQELLGHADLSTTQVYTQVSRELLKSVYFKTHPAAMSSKTRKKR